jgi:phosphoglycolate phosphatase-like HAD superfamily hydrolase
MKPKILIYDFDGVICDSVDVKTEAFVELYKEYNADIQASVRKYHLNNGGISRYEKIKYFQKELLGLPESEEMIKDLSFRFADLVKEKVINSTYINGARDFIEKHATDCAQYICTGTPEFEIIEIVERRGLTKFFSGVYGSPKSKPVIIRQILEETSATVMDCVFLGDAITDYNTAIECNVPFIGLKNTNTVFPKGTILINDFHDIRLEFLSSKLAH